MNPAESKEPLSQTLAAWRILPKSNPNFRPAVWARIRQSSRETWAVYVQAHLAAWSAVAVLAIMTAGVAGVSAARARLSADRETMVVTYLVGLDPRVQAKLRP
jgi:hypothetical protein